MQRRGISLISMIIYVVLFFGFSAIAISLTTNMNMKTLAKKGSIYCQEQIEKLQYNLIDSAKKSEYFDNVSGTIVFSNNDEYKYDDTKKCILKNGGVLVKDVSSFQILSKDGITGFSDINKGHIDKNINYITIKVTIFKYSKSYDYELFITLGDGLSG